MTKKWQKRIDAMTPKMREELLVIVENIIALRLSNYDVTSLQGYPWLFRVRKWKIRVIFSKQWGKWEILKIDFRGDIYKWM